MIYREVCKMLKYILGGFVILDLVFIYCSLVVSHRCSEKEEKDGKR
jgi:hypothetical protein